MTPKYKVVELYTSENMSDHTMSTGAKDRRLDPEKVQAMINKETTKGIEEQVQGFARWELMFEARGFLFFEYVEE